MKFEQILKKMVEKNTIPFIEKIDFKKNQEQIKKIEDYLKPIKIPKSYLSFLNVVGFGGPYTSDINGTSLLNQPSLIIETEKDVIFYTKINIAPPKFKRLLLSINEFGNYYMNLDKCDPKTTECEIQTWHSGYPPEEQPEELQKETYKSFEEFFRAMNSELVEIIESGKEIPEDYIIQTDEEIQEKIAEKTKQKQKSFFRKIIDKIF